MNNEEKDALFEIIRNLQEQITVLREVIKNLTEAQKVTNNTIVMLSKDLYLPVK